MSLGIRVLMMVGLVASLTSVAHAIAGQALLYTPPYVPSTCYGMQDSGNMIVTVNNGLYGNGEACGTRYRVICTGPTNQDIPQPCRSYSVDVTVVGNCLECKSNQINLSVEAFAIIANPSAESITIEYSQIYTETENLRMPGISS